MTTKTKSRILEAVHERPAICIAWDSSTSARCRNTTRCAWSRCRTTTPKVKALRERLHLSQAVLASVLNTSTSTVRKWEVGDKRPSGPSQKLLDILERKGLEAVL
jgi:putative transcriptional regulator